MPMLMLQQHMSEHTHVPWMCLFCQNFNDKMASILSWQICILLCRWVVAGNLWNLSNLLDLFDLWVLRRPVSGRHLDVAPGGDIHSCVGCSFLCSFTSCFVFLFLKFILHVTDVTLADLMKIQTQY